MELKNELDEPPLCHPLGGAKSKFRVSFDAEPTLGAVPSATLAARAPSKLEINVVMTRI